MKTIGIGDIQKNTSIFNNLTEAMEIVDKRKKVAIAIVLPIKSSNIVLQLAGKYRTRVANKSADLTLAKEQSMIQAMEEKYGLSN